MVDHNNTQDVLRARFRANPSYELVPFERLDSAHQQALAGVADDRDHYGLLLPREEPELGVKAVCCDTALLFSTLREPGTLPHYLQLRAREDPMKEHETNRELVELVLDGILEMEVGDRFVHGPDARQWVLDEATEPSPCDALAEISHAALRVAQTLPLKDPALVCARLYHFNCVPAGARLRRKYGTEEARAQALGLTPGGYARQILGKAFNALDGGSGDGWWIWAARAPGVSRVEKEGPEGTYKLYVSPLPDALPAVFPLLVEVFAAIQVPQFKVGRGLDGWLRPDKLVAYFDDLSGVRAAARLLADAMGSRVVGQGVPFTASMDGNPLLSWGVDPPASARVNGWRGRESWRMWIVQRLARSLVQAQEHEGVQPWRHALERLALDGVDTDTWIPSRRVWGAGQEGAAQ